MTQSFYPKFAGIRFKSTATDYTQIHVNPRTGGGEVLNYAPGVVVTLSGWGLFVQDGLYYFQIEGNPNFYIQYYTPQLEWQRIDNSATQHSAASAQELVNGIISNNRYILNNNLLCARFANKLTREQRLTLYNLQKRLERRNEALKNEQLLTNQEDGYPEGYSEFGNYLESFMSSPNIGVVTLSATAIICIAAVVIGSLSTAAYFAYKAYYEESKNDVKYSKQLTQTLQNKLTEEEYQQLLQETAGLLTKQRITQQIASIGGNLKNLLLVGLGLLIALRAPQWIKAAQDKPVSYGNKRISK